jgi:chaperone modulatory protein CbpM
MSHKRIYTLEQAARATGAGTEQLVTYVRREWIRPESERELDQEDVARIRLILELQNELGVNDEGIPLILHLLDQLYYLRFRLQRGR